MREFGRSRLRSRQLPALPLVLLFLLLPEDVHAQPVHPDSLERVSLAGDTVIAGVPCARTTGTPAEFFLDGRLAGCFLAREHDIGAHRFPRGTWLDVNQHGAIWGAWLATDTRLDGHLCRGDGYKRWSVRFHPTGALSGCYLRNDTVVDGVPCIRGTFLNEIRGGSRTSLQLHANGRLRRCQASRNATVDGRSVRKWDVVEREAGAPASRRDPAMP